MTDQPLFALLDALAAGHDDPTALSAALQVPPEQVHSALREAQGRGLVAGLDRPDGPRPRLTERGTTVVRLRQELSGTAPRVTSRRLALRVARTWAFALLLVTLVVTVVTLVAER